MKVLITYIILLFALTNVVFGQKGGWRVVGTIQVKFTADHDGIVIQGPYNNFQSIKIKVTDAPLRLVKIVVTFDSGAPDNIEMINDIPKGGESDVISLSGVDGRKIKKIDFWYDTQGLTQGKASITISGKNG